MPREPNPNFMAGVPELMILRLLQDREMYGYELVQAIRTESADVISFGEGVVYPVLHGLEDEGAVTSRRKLVEGRSRVYYTLTVKGERRYRQLVDTWSSLAQAIQSVLKGSRYATEL
jgi:PadR family transcriptional regulator, regulatory protein PadR